MFVFGLKSYYSKDVFCVPPSHFQIIPPGLAAGSFPVLVFFAFSFAVGDVFAVNVVAVGFVPVGVAGEFIFHGAA